MNCLTKEQLIELVYAEEYDTGLVELQKHLVTCESCSRSYWELVAVHNWVRKHDRQEPAPAPIILKPARTLLQRLSGMAAAAALLLTLATGSMQLVRLTGQVETLQTRNQNLDQQLQQAQYRMDQSHRDQYMLMMALKDYMDQNLSDRRVSYVTAP